jgi:hypothetical protein
MNVSTWVPSAAMTDPSPHTLIRSSIMKALTTSAMALFSFSTVTWRRAVAAEGHQPGRNPGLLDARSGPGLPQRVIVPGVACNGGSAVTYRTRGQGWRC